MTRRWIGPVLAVVLLVATATLWWTRGDGDPGWTSRSPEALEELQAGLDDVERFYWSDATAHFERALELDPEIPMAKLQLAVHYASDDGRRRLLWRELEEMPEDAMNPRERALVGYWLERQSPGGPAPRRVLERYLEDRGPEGDAYVLSALCNDQWEKQEWDAAESCYRRLVERHPNWVQAHSRLGLIAMARGELERADESFQTFRYIAPDQALPHDSLGQLETVIGRYEDAEKSFRKALEVKSDYCMANQHLMRLYTLWGRWAESAEIIDRMNAMGSCDYMREWGVLCAGRAWNRYASGDSEGAREILEGGCLELRGGFDLLAHRMAVISGNDAAADAMEQAIEGHIDAKNEAGFQGRSSYLESLLAHARGVRAYVAGDFKSACDLLEQSDEIGLYWGLERAALKLYNRQHLARCYEQAGHAAAATAMRGKISAVNPRFLEVERTADIDRAWTERRTSRAARLPMDRRHLDHDP